MPQGKMSETILCQAPQITPTQHHSVQLSFACHDWASKMIFLLADMRNPTSISPTSMHSLFTVFPLDPTWYFLYIALPLSQAELVYPSYFKGSFPSSILAL